MPSEEQQAESRRTVAVAAGRLHQLVVLVVASHGLVAVPLATLLDVALDLHTQLTLQAPPLREDTVRPVPHRLGVVLVARAVLGLTQRVCLMVPALLPFFALTCTNTRRQISRNQESGGQPGGGAPPQAAWLRSPTHPLAPFCGSGPRCSQRCKGRTWTRC